MKTKSLPLSLLAIVFAFAVATTGCKKKTKAPETRTTKQTPAKSKKKTTPKAATKTKKIPAKVKDYVCGMTIDRKTAPHQHSHKGHTYYFCNRGCYDKFTKTPDKYAAMRKQ